MLTSIYYSLLLCVVSVTAPRVKLLLNELGLDEEGGTKFFIEVKRDHGTEEIGLDHHYLAVLNTGYSKEFHLALRGLIKLKGTSLSSGQTIGYVGDQSLNENKHLVTFGNNHVGYPSRFNPGNLINVNDCGYLIIMSIYSEIEYWNAGELRPLKGSMKDWILNHLDDVSVVRGLKAGKTSPKLEQLLSSKVPTGILQFLEDTSHIPDISQSNCEMLPRPFRKDWRLTAPTVGEENTNCPGGDLPRDVDMAELSESSGEVPEDVDMESDCRFETLSDGSFVNQEKLDKRLLAAKASGSSCPSADGEMAEIRAQVSVNKKRKLILSNDDPEVVEDPWCRKSQFQKEAWTSHIEQYQSDLLPLAGKNTILLIQKGTYLV